MVILYDSTTGSIIRVVGDGNELSPEKGQAVKYFPGVDIPADILDLKYDGEKLIENTQKKIDEENNRIKQELAYIDLKSIRSIREYIVAQNDAPEFLKTHEASAKKAREGLK